MGLQIGERPDIRANELHCGIAQSRSQTTITTETMHAGGAGYRQFKYMVHVFPVVSGSLVPRPRPVFRRFLYGKVGGIFFT